LLQEYLLLSYTTEQDASRGKGNSQEGKGITVLYAGSAFSIPYFKVCKYRIRVTGIKGVCLTVQQHGDDFIKVWK
jgi:hypothetical protein